MIHESIRMNASEIVVHDTMDTNTPDWNIGISCMTHVPHERQNSHEKRSHDDR